VEEKHKFCNILVKGVTEKKEIGVTLQGEKRKGKCPYLLGALLMGKG